MKKNLIYVLLVLILLSGCSKKDIPETVTTNKDTSISTQIIKNELNEDISALIGTWSYKNNGLEVTYTVSSDNSVKVNNGLEGKISLSDKKEYDYVADLSKTEDSKVTKVVAYLKLDSSNNLLVYNPNEKGEYSEPLTFVKNTDSAVNENKETVANNTSNSTSNNSAKQNTSTEKKETKQETKTESKPASNNSSTNTNTNSSTQKSGHYEERTVLVREAYDEQVVTKEGWTEKVLVKEGWTESYDECTNYSQESWEVFVCDATGDVFTSSKECAYTCDGSWHNQMEYGEEACTAWSTRTIDHPAEYNEIYHEPEYTTVHHDAEYKTEKVWVED